jgi:hypothetical protein
VPDDFDAEESSEWVVVNDPPTGVASVRLRGRRSESGRFVITDLHLHGDQLTAESLRGLSLARLEAKLNSSLRGSGGVREVLSRRSDETDPDDFYRIVADAYVEYAAQSKAPGKAIAEEARVPASTAHRWIRQARHRGFLPVGQKGRVG